MGNFGRDLRGLQTFQNKKSRFWEPAFVYWQDKIILKDSYKTIPD